MLTHSSRPWARELHRFVADHGGALVCGYAVSQESAVDADYDILFVDDVTSFLSPRLVTMLHDKGIRIVGIYDPLDGGDTGARLLESYGVDVVIPSPSAADDLLAAIFEVGPNSGPRPVVSAERDFPAAADTQEVVVVTGAAGGVGATEVAIALAGELAALVPSVLVDADTEQPAIAQRLGLPPHPNLLSACDRVQHNESVAGSFLNHREMACPIIGGIPDPSRWASVRPAELAALLLELSTDRTVVVNTGTNTEDLAGFGIDRFLAARAALAAASRVVLVAAADPVGVRRTIDWLALSRDLVATLPVHLVLNHCPGGAPARRELEREVSRNHGFVSVSVVAADRHVRSAAWRASPVRKGPVRRVSRHIAVATSSEVR
jgi:MinD-like ATPase involved in chromosome partitioning or flagellar assembly